MAKKPACYPDIRLIGINVSTELRIVGNNTNLDSSKRSSRQHINFHTNRHVVSVVSQQTMGMQVDICLHPVSTDTWNVTLV